MKAAAMFAAAYGFPPSACASQEEALGLLHNIKTALALRSATFARGVAVCFSQDANAELMADLGAPAKEIARVKLNAMRQRGVQ